MKKLRITIGGKSYDVTVEVLEDDQAARPMVAAVAPGAAGAPEPAGTAPAAAAVEPTSPVAEGSVLSPMAGTVKSVAVKEGDSVSQGQVVVVLDAMKMENQVVSPCDGTVKSVSAAPGDTVSEGQPLLVIG